MRLRYDWYVEFEDEQTEDEADVSREMAKNAFGDGVMGISASGLHENGYVLTAMLYLDPALVFDDVTDRFPGELPADMEERLTERAEDELDGVVDVIVQRVPSS